MGDIVAADSVEDHDVLFAALEGIDAGDLDSFFELLFVCLELLDKKLFQTCDLSLVWGHYADLTLI